MLEKIIVSSYTLDTLVENGFAIETLGMTRNHDWVIKPTSQLLEFMIENNLIWYQDLFNLI